MKKIVVLSLLYAVANNCFAGTTEGKIREMFFHQNSDKIMFNLSSNSPNFTDCAKTLRYAFRLNTDQGKAMLSALMYVKAARKKIVVYGKNSCSIHGDSEDISYFKIAD